MAEYFAKLDTNKKLTPITTKILLVSDGSDVPIELYEASTSISYGLYYGKHPYKGYGDGPREAIINLLNKLP